MPKISVSRSVVINAPVGKVFSTVQNLKMWHVWSPWANSDLSQKNTITGTGTDTSSVMAWEGKLSGTGNMKFTNIDVNKAIAIDLTFLKPWKSTAKTNFYFEETKNGTKVTWDLDSSLPWFMFWMKNQMQAFIGMDYVRGLNMLKEWSETGLVLTKTEDLGKKMFDGTEYIGIKTKCSIQEMPEKMGADFEILEGAFKNGDFEPKNPAFCQYIKYDPVKNVCTYIAGVGVTKEPKNLPEHVFFAKLPATKAHVLRHTGDYKHLGNPWVQGMNMARAKMYKASRMKAFEVYVNHPKMVEKHELITDLYFPCK